jgi:hypothetical protein
LISIQLYTIYNLNIILQELKSKTKYIPNIIKKLFNSTLDYFYILHDNKELYLRLNILQRDYNWEFSKNYTKDFKLKIKYKDMIYMSKFYILDTKKYLLFITYYVFKPVHFIANYAKVTTIIVVYRCLYCGIFSLFGELNLNKTKVYTEMLDIKHYITEFIKKIYSSIYKILSYKIPNTILYLNKRISLNLKY